MITGAQIRQGRELLGWRQAELATKAKVETHFVESAESSDTVCFVPVEFLDAMRGALENAGVEFTNGDEPGVKLVAARAKRLTER
jgi:transcriptional regulator with XRE-family HTH domain